KMVIFLKSNLTSQSKARGIFNGIELKKNRPQRKKVPSQEPLIRQSCSISKNEISLEINNMNHLAVVSIFNNLKYDKAYPIVIVFINHITCMNIFFAGRSYEHYNCLICTVILQHMIAIIIVSFM